MAMDARADAQRLYDVSTSLYNTWMFFGVYIPAAIGGIAVLCCLIGAASSREVSLIVFGLGIGCFFGLICMLNYMMAVLSTHFAKVLSHLLLATIGP